jgi:hypothetical protein
MSNFALIISICILALSSTTAPAQTLCLGKSGKPCTPEEARQVLEQRCKDEASPPNLSIASSVRLTGVLLDPTGAPITFEKTMVQLKDPRSNAVLRSAPLDSEGRFDFGVVPAGQFRFIAVMLKDGKPARLPLADQPEALSCSRADECRLEITIHFHGTDDPVDFCPPK